MPPPSSDAELVTLIDRIAQRDETALRALYDLTSPRLFGLAMRVLRRRDAAEDVLQESFLTVWRAAGDYRLSLSPPLAWLGVIVRSRALDALRKHASARADRTQELDDSLGHTLASDAPDPSSLTGILAQRLVRRLCPECKRAQPADASEQAAALHTCLQRLEARQREVVSLAYLRDLSHSELAQQLALPLGTVKTWIRRGLEQLRGCMARYV